MWDQEANDAFEMLKKSLAEAPVLAAPASKEPLLLYVTAGPRAVSAVVVVERKEEGKEYCSGPALKMARSLCIVQIPGSNRLHTQFHDEYHNKGQIITRMIHINKVLLLQIAQLKAGSKVAAENN